MLRHAQLCVYEGGETIPMSSLTGLPHIAVLIRGCMALVGAHGRIRSTAGPGAVLGTWQGLLHERSALQLRASSSVVLLYTLPIDEIKVGLLHCCLLFI